MNVDAVGVATAPALDEGHLINEDDIVAPVPAVASTGIPCEAAAVVTAASSSLSSTAVFGALVKGASGAFASEMHALGLPWGADPLEQVSPYISFDPRRCLGERRFESTLQAVAKVRPSHACFSALPCYGRTR
jgi:hypothetical protein